MKYHYIAIEREFGSGGTKIAKQLSEETGIPCYGREILEELSKLYHVSPEEIESFEEKATNSLLYSLYMLSQMQQGEEKVVSREGRMFLEEQRVIRQLASAGNGIFLGHCAAEALKNREGVLKVFIHASLEEKKKRIEREYQIEPGSIERVRKRYDRKRANYYHANTAKKWDDLWQYDVVLDSSRLGVGGCVRALKGFFEG